MGFAQDLPFGRDRSDVVYALEVIEHVGVEDGQWKLLPNHLPASVFYEEASR
jgi:hypothetical protein